MRVRFVSSGQNVEDALTINQTLLGTSLKPLAPVNLRGTRNTTGDLLIEWTRRGRYGAGVRPADVPVTEEKESFIVEIYDGATLKRTIPIAITSQPVIWTTQNQYASTSGSTLTATAASTIAVAEAAQRLERPGDYIEFTIKKGGSSTTFGLFVIPAGTRAPLIGLDSSVGVLTWGAASGGYTVSTFHAPVFYSDGDRVRAMVTDTDIRVYNNYLAISDSPDLISAFPPEFPLKIEAHVGHTGSAAEMQNATIYRGTPSTVYTVAQQTQDFGSTQNPITVRVYQVSQVAGNGAYVQASL